MRLNEGLYRGKVMSWGLGQQEKAPHNLYFWLTFMVQGEVTDQNDPSKDKKVPHEERTIRRFLTNKGSLEWLAADLKTLGFTGKFDLPRLDPSEPDAYDFSDKEFLATCRYQAGNNGNGTYESWRITKPAAKPVAAEKDAVSRASDRFNDLMNNLLKDKKEAAKEDSDESSESLADVDVPY